MGRKNDAATILHDPPPYLNTKQLATLPGR